MSDFEDTDNNNNVISLEEHRNNINYFDYLNSDCLAVKRYTPIGLLTVIVNPNFTTETNIQPYFVVAKELAEKLGYPKTDNIVSILDSLESKTLSNRDLNEIKDLRECLGVDEIAPRGMTLISEPGLYHILQHSKKPEAVEFRDNVNSIILPNIRQHGKYSANENLEQIGSLINEKLQPLLEELSNKDKKIINLLENEITRLKREVELKENTVIDIVKTTYTFRECCNTLRINFKTKFGEVNIDPPELKKFLIDIGLLKTNGVVKRTTINSNLMDEKYNVTQIGFKIIVDKAIEKGYIIPII